jgi:hypothetical protein
MVTAVHYFATLEDQMIRLDYLGEPAKVTLHPWPVITSPLSALSREDALERPRVMVVVGLPVPVCMGVPAPLHSQERQRHSKGAGVVANCEAVEVLRNSSKLATSPKD